MSEEKQLPAEGINEIRIHESVIATIVRKVAGRVEGVSRISGSSLMDNIAEIMGSKRLQDRAISVQMGDSNVSVEVSVNLVFGYKLPEVALSLQREIRKEIEAITGLQVFKVDVVVCEIDEPAEPAADKQEE